MPREYGEHEWRPLPGGIALHCPATDDAYRRGLLPLGLRTPPRPARHGFAPTLRVESDPRAGETLWLRESNWGYRRDDVLEGWDPSFVTGRRDNTLGVLSVTRLADGSVLFLRERDGRPLPAGGGAIGPGDLAAGMTLDRLALAAGLRELDEETDGLIGREHVVAARALAVVRYPHRGGRPDLAIEIRTKFDPRLVPAEILYKERPGLVPYPSKVVSATELEGFLRDTARRVPVNGALYGLLRLGVLVP